MPALDKGLKMLLVIDMGIHMTDNFDANVIIMYVMG